MQQLFDAFMQGACVVVEDGRNFPLLRVEPPKHAIGKQGYAFAQGRERRLQFVRDMAQDAVAISLQLAQAQAQPVQLLAHAAQISRAVDGDAVLETALSEVGDALLNAAQRAQQPPGAERGETDGECEGDQDPPRKQVAALVEGLEQIPVLYLEMSLEVSRKPVVEPRKGGKGGRRRCSR